MEYPVIEEIYSASINLEDQDFSIPSTRVVAAIPYNACSPLRNNVTNLLVMIEDILVGTLL